jgi:hypothetical protein
VISLSPQLTDLETYAKLPAPPLIIALASIFKIVDLEDGGIAHDHRSDLWLPGSLILKVEVLHMITALASTFRIVDLEEWRFLCLVIALTCGFQDR